MKKEKELHIEKVKSFVKGLLDDSLPSFGATAYKPAKHEDVEEWWAQIEAFGKSGNRHGPQAQAKRDGRDALMRMLVAREEKIKKVIEDTNWDSIL